MARNQAKRPARRTDAEIPVVGGREPCPCGSGRRYKACHGRTDRSALTRTSRTGRPFAGLAAEAQWIALREFVACAYAPLQLTGDAAEKLGDQQIYVTTVLPGASASWVRPDGAIFVSCQAVLADDPARALAATILAALELGVGEYGTPAVYDEDGPTLADVVADVPLEITTAESFDFWLVEGTEPDELTTATKERADEAVELSRFMPTVEGAVVSRAGSHTFLRWVMPGEEEPMLDAFARVKANGGLTLGGAKFLGMFRASGVLVPVWELPAGAELDSLDEAAAEFQTRVEAAKKETGPLDAATRRHRQGLQSRQVTI